MNIKKMKTLHILFMLLQINIGFSLVGMENENGVGNPPNNNGQQQQQNNNNNNNGGGGQQAQNAVPEEPFDLIKSANKVREQMAGAPLPTRIYYTLFTTAYDLLVELSKKNQGEDLPKITSQDFNTLSAIFNVDNKSIVKKFVHSCIEYTGQAAGTKFGTSVVDHVLNQHYLSDKEKLDKINETRKLNNEQLQQYRELLAVEIDPVRKKVRENDIDMLVHRMNEDLRTSVYDIVQPSTEPFIQENMKNMKWLYKTYKAKISKYDEKGTEFQLSDYELEYENNKKKANEITYNYNFQFLIEFNLLSLFNEEDLEKIKKETGKNIEEIKYKYLEDQKKDPFVLKDPYGFFEKFRPVFNVYELGTRAGIDRKKIEKYVESKPYPIEDYFHSFEERDFKQDPLIKNGINHALMNYKEQLRLLKSEEVFVASNNDDLKVYLDRIVEVKSDIDEIFKKGFVGHHLKNKISDTKNNPALQKLYIEQSKKLDNEYGIMFSQLNDTSKTLEERIVLKGRENSRKVSADSVKQKVMRHLANNKKEYLALVSLLTTVGVTYKRFR